MAALLGMGPVVLILDDGQLLQGSTATTDLNRLVQIRPPQARIILSGGYLPDQRLARLRVAQKVSALTGQDLACTTIEAAAMFRNSGHGRPAALAATLGDRAEGWPAPSPLVTPDMLPNFVTDLERALLSGDLDSALEAAQRLVSMSHSAPFRGTASASARSPRFPSSRPRVNLRYCVR